MTRRNDRRAGDPRGPFAGHSLWWWGSAAVTAVAVVGAAVLLALPF
ncbi:hypothetical protein [Microbacterium lushaniae]|nr:hypothetical protein [Microbacterium lushaniae]